jgi:methylated-DNA-[protein]-cysteine S-methyltransferase
MDYALQTARLATPIGNVEIEGDDARLTAIRITVDSDSRLTVATGAVAAALEQMTEYFAGERQHFALPLAPAASARGQALRDAIASVGYGETATYGQLARTHGSGNQAMGQACARNPFPIIIPCHRVTSANGARENYSAGDGVTTKAWLIAHEARHRRLTP